MEELKITELEKVRQEIKVLEKKLELLKEIETHKSQPRMNLKDTVTGEVVSCNDEIYYRLQFNHERHSWFKKIEKLDGNLLNQITDGETYRLLEGLWFNDVKKGKYDEPYCPDDPEWYDEVECDEKDNPNLHFTINKKIIDKMVEERKAQKLWNRLHDELGLTDSACLRIVDVVEEWLPKEQSSSGSQNVNTELLVEGFNDCVRKMKEMLS